MEVTSYRDLKHHYLVIKLTNPDRDDYQFRMVEQNTLSGFVGCSIHNINGEACLYYEVDGRESLQSRCSTRKLSFEELRRLLQDLCRAGEEAQEYLLDPAGFLLTPQFIFAEPSTGQFLFCFCPGTEERHDFNAFAAELIALTDPADAQAADAVYRLCERAQHGRLLPAEALNEISGAAPADSKPVVQHKREDPAPVLGGWPVEPGRPPAEQPKLKAEAEDVTPGGGRRGGVAMGFLFLAVAAALIAVRYFYVLTPRENLLDLGVMMVCLAFGTIMILLSLRGARKTEKAQMAVPVSAGQNLFSGEAPMPGNTVQTDMSEAAWQTPVPVVNPLSTPQLPPQMSAVNPLPTPQLPPQTPAVTPLPVTQLSSAPSWALPDPPELRPQTMEVVPDQRGAVLLDFGVPNTDRRYQLFIRDVSMV
ncbi:MAG: hypothetical protein IJT34_06515 [Butyrivibrio sp.]|nr:hypothetical protein [Butyrivibrio sp.]